MQRPLEPQPHPIQQQATTRRRCVRILQRAPAHLEKDATLHMVLPSCANQEYEDVLVLWLLCIVVLVLRVLLLRSSCAMKPMCNVT
ncbi:hypothetical protein ACSBR1_020322 [Camellia fascicularis]